jgi:hypothetical protein
VALRVEDVEFVESEGVNIYIRRSKADQEGAELVKGLPYGSGQETCPVTAPRQWLPAAEAEVEGSFEGGHLPPLLSRGVYRRKRHDSPVRVYGSQAPR